MFKSLINKFFAFMSAPDEVVNFNARTRNEWIALKAASIAPGSRVLDAGAGECQYKNLFNHCDYKTQDFAEYTGMPSGMLAEKWKYGNIDYICDIAQIPVSDASFDAVICTEVLEHVPRPIAVLKELSRVLMPGGTLILTAPLSSGVHQQPFHYYGGYSPFFYKKFLSDYSLEIVELKPVGGLMKHVAQEISRVGRILQDRDSVNLSLFMRYILTCMLPKFLAKMDDDVFVEEFTVGYLVEARKKHA